VSADTEHRLTHDIDVWVARGPADAAPCLDVVLDAGQIEPGDADGDREGGPAQEMGTR
jgi:hypothetical protein